MPRVSLRFHGDLEELLPHGRRNPVVVAAPEGASAGAIVEDLGIPHTEIGALSAGGRPVGLAYRPADDDELAVHPFRPCGAGGGERPRFILDVHLGRLARLLRLLGFDAAWHRDAADADLAAVAVREDRILLSRDRGLLKRREVKQGCLVRSQEPRHQLVEVAERYGLHDRLEPFSRCMVCNAPLSRGEDPPGRPDAGCRGRCTSCGRRYWRGSHWRALNEIVEEVRGGRRSAVDHPPSTVRTQKTRSPRSPRA